MDKIIRKNNLKLALKVMGMDKKEKSIYKVDIHDPNFELPLSKLEKTY